MANILSKIKSRIDSKIKYAYLKNLPEQKYEDFLEKEYERRTGKTFDFNNLQSYTQKMQYAKLYDLNPLKTILSDKYLVRSWVEKKIGEKYLIPLLGVWEKYSEIEFKDLPERFVLKTNNGSGGNLIVEDKKKINHIKEKIKFDSWINTNFAYFGDLQLHYKDIKPRIIAEKFIQDSSGDLKEYKFFCFDGVAYYCWYLKDENDKRYGNVYDMNWGLQPWHFQGIDNFPYEIEKPDRFNDMKEIVENLSAGFSHVRVDLYNVDGEIYFGEMTFTSQGGYRLIVSDEYDYRLGNLWDLDTSNKYQSK